MALATQATLGKAAVWVMCSVTKRWRRLDDADGATRDVRNHMVLQNDMIMWFRAARNGFSEDIESGLARGVKVDALCAWRHGRTALWLASSGGHASVVTRLIEANASVNCHDIGLDDDTPLHAAAYNGHAKVLQILIKAGAAPHVKNANGKTARDLLAPQAREAVLALLEGESRICQELQAFAPQELQAPEATVGDPAESVLSDLPTCPPGCQRALARARASRQQASADQDASKLQDAQEAEADAYERQDAQADTKEAAAAAEAKVLAAAAAAAPRGGRESAASVFEV